MEPSQKVSLELEQKTQVTEGYVLGDLLCKFENM